MKLLVFAALLLAEESREARGIAKQAETARASAADSAETLATAFEELITSRVDKLRKRSAAPPRACRQLSQNRAETSWIAARNVLASLS